MTCDYDHERLLAEIARLTRKRDEARQALTRLRAEFAACCACRSNAEGDIVSWCRAHADVREERDRLRTLLRRLEWRGQVCPCHRMPTCLVCTAAQGDGHGDDCEMKAALE